MRRIALLLMIGTVGLSACGLSARNPRALPSQGGTGSAFTAFERHPEGSRIIWTRAGHPRRPAPPRAATDPSGSSGTPAGSPRPCSASSGGTEGTPAVQLTDVRVGAHEGYDRVTFEFGAPDGSSSASSGVPRF